MIILSFFIFIGCLPCECDLGGAVNNSCNPINGQCRCQPNVRDRQCLRYEQILNSNSFYVLYLGGGGILAFSHH